MLIDFIEDSKWMKYKIIVDDETVKINLLKELIIDEDNITQQVLEHPRVFGFLSRVHKYLVKQAKRAEINRKKVRAQRMEYLQKNGVSITGSKEMVDKDKQYVDAHHKQIELEYKRDTLESILESFKHRKDLMQTLSANIRSER
jgi:hypothetical protein